MESKIAEINRMELARHSHRLVVSSGHAKDTGLEQRSGCSVSTRVRSLDVVLSTLLGFISMDNWEYVCYE